MARTTELNFQKFFGNRKRFNEIDPRFLTHDVVTYGKLSGEGLVKFPFKLARVLTTEPLYEVWRRTKGKGTRIKQPIFMLGVPHSGTSIAMRLFAKHPDVANQSEAQTILQPMGLFDYENGDSVLTEQDATDEETDRLHARFGFYTWLHRKKRFFNKCPSNTVRIPFLAKIFPDAYFMHVVRDGRAVVNSLLGPPSEHWERKDRFTPFKERKNPFPGAKPPNWRELLRDDPVEQHALQWREVIKYGQAKAKQCNIPCRYLKYEDLCGDTRKVIGELWEFCGLPVTQEILERVPATLGSRNYKWKKFLSDEQKELINTIQGPLLKELGYI